MATSNLEIKSLKKLILKGNIRQVVEELIHFTEGSTAHMTTEIYLTAARYRQLESEKLRGQIALADYKVEFNTIVSSLLEIIDAIQHAAVGTYQQVCPKKQVREELAALSEEFAAIDQLKSLTSRIRMKIHIARKMAEKLIPWPDLIYEYKGTTDQAMICAISRKVKILAVEGDIDILESIAANATDNVTKGFVTNALAELIYAAQVRWGDEGRMLSMLDILGKEGDKPLLTNVVRVRAAVEMMTGMHP